MAIDLIAEYENRPSPSLIRFVAAEAEKSAAAVADYLGRAGLAPPSGETRGFPREVLLDLAGVLKLRAWEAAGIRVPRDAALPTAREALDELIRILGSAATDPGAIPRLGRLARSVLALAVDRFAWHGPTDLGADIVLDTPDEDTLVEAMARFLLSQRRCRSHSA